MKLKQLLKGIEYLDCRGSKEIDITGLASDSRLVAPGNLFIARKGEKHDGSHYVCQAIDAGARAIVTDVYDPFIKIAQIIVENPRKIEAILAAQYYRRPSQKLWVAGITGTKGKTTSSYLVRHLLEGLNEKCGLVGTVETIIGESRFDAEYTTRDAITNQKLLSAMVTQGCKAAVLEVSSHGLEQGRVDEIEFDAALFTNLHSDHLDYHKTIENYALAKAKLFTKLKGVSILNADCAWSSWMKGGKKTISFGIEEVADVQAKEICLTEEGISFFVDGVPFSSSLIGLFNVYNMLGAISLGLSKGKSLADISSILATFPGVPGRLQRIKNNRNIHVFVDYAHTGESLEKVLMALRKVARKRIIVVFGCGGNRDPNRRKDMARAAEQFADLSFITSDNPRSEDPNEICRQILQGYKSLEKVFVELDRRSAIARALLEAKPNDLVLIAGKGHEKVQIFLDKTVTFDDVAVAEEVLRS